MADSLTEPGVAAPLAADDGTGTPGAGPEGFDAGSGAPGGGGSWRSVWQAPSLVLALVALLGALWFASAHAPEADFDQLLDAAERLIEREEHQAALELLNRDTRPYLEHERFGLDHRRRFHVLRGRAIFLGQRALGIDRRDNNENIIGEFLEAERLGIPLSARDAEMLGHALISRGLHDRAVERARLLHDAEPARANGLVRRVVEVRLAGRGFDFDGTLDLIADFVGDPLLAIEDRAWAEARQAELLLQHGFVDDAIRKLLRGMPRIAGAPASARGELSLLLGRAYLEAGAVKDAGDELARALEVLFTEDPLRGDVEVLLGRVEEVNGDFQAARERYGRVVDEWAETNAALAATFGIGETEAALHNDEEAVEAFREVVRAVTGRRRHPELTRPIVGERLMGLFEDRFTAGRTEAALQYASLAEALFGVDDAPPPVLRALGQVNRRLAEEAIAEANPGPADLAALASLDPATRELARRRYVAAGGYFRMHANRIVLSDNAGYGDSLWLAGDSFDRAGDQEEAIAAFGEYVGGFTSDPRQAEARFRLAQAHQARGDYGIAADFYNGLIADAADPVGGRGVGPFADASYVPLAQTYLLDGDATNDARAEELLRLVISGALGEPEMPAFRDAVLELGQHCYRVGRFGEAIEHLGRAETLFTGDERSDLVRYRLADAYRREAAAIAQTLQEGMPEEERRALEGRRRDWLASALRLFEGVAGVLGARDQRRLSALERVALRNAYFYMGDCAFDLGDHEAAIHHYDRAKDRYPEDAASLVAMTQIVNAYLMQGNVALARTANDRAIRFFESLPASAWDDPDLPMSNEDWKRWLDSTSRLAGASGGRPDSR